MTFFQRSYLLTSESVSPGHSDKICDQVSDAILDAVLKKDPYAFVACEVMATAKKMIIAGEITSKVQFKQAEYIAIARQVLQEIGYDDPVYSIDYKTYDIEVLIQPQSPELNSQQNKTLSVVAGDQGIVFGFASNESHDYMPLPITLAHALVHKATTLMKQGVLPNVKPDMKSQVTINYKNKNHVTIYAMLMSVQHDTEIDLQKFRNDIEEKVMNAVALEYNLNLNFHKIVNPLGEFTIGGPQSDTGLTGRKIIVDTYGGSARHGGGCFSGKDCTKIDRSVAYMCRYVAKNLVASGIAKKIEIQVAFVIGQETPISYWIKTFNSSVLSDHEIIDIIKQEFDFSLAGIIKKLELRKPIFQKTATYGHFSEHHEETFPWEKTDMKEYLKQLLKQKLALKKNL